MKTNFYVDGFNLYHGSVEDTEYKWLDLSKLFRSYYPSDQINRIRYFTAPSSTHRGRLQRQSLYLRALKTIPNLFIHRGYFQSNKKWKRPVNPPHSNVEVWITEEKGTDVNLASFLLLDAFKNNYEQAIVVSNDADLATPIRLVRNELGLRVGLLNPQKNASKVLRAAADSSLYRQIRQGALRASLFPDTLTDAKGTFRKPASW